MQTQLSALKPAAMLEDMTPQKPDGVRPRDIGPRPSLSIGAQTLQRACACGGTCGDCAKDDEAKSGGAGKMLQRKVARPSQSLARSDGGAVPAIVQDVLRSPGQPLDKAAMDFAEPRFGGDFHNVRIHTDSTAAKSARAVNAAAYTVGNHIAFDAGRYAPQSAQGQRLLAHELTHVLQNGSAKGPVERISSPEDASEREAEAMADRAMQGGRAEPRSRGGESISRLSRLVSNIFNCAAAVDSAPADPRAAITGIDAEALRMAQETVDQLTAEAALVTANGLDPTSAVQIAYANRFGLPAAAGAGFMNRLTGVVRPTQAAALAEELTIMARRFRLSVNLFSQNVIYRCTHGGITFANCGPINCNNIFAEACDGIGVIFLCPTFWTGNSANQQAAILIHESMHILLAQVRDAAVGGHGGNFRFAECYGSFVADLQGFNTIVAACPAPV